jgi:probable FeS assembly SUF system protein SufT
LQENSETVRFTRDVEVIQVPSGDRMVVHEGDSGLITQAMGGTFTIVTNNGFMVRLQEKDADSIGREDVAEQAKQKLASEVASAEEMNEQVWEQLRTCYDPEIPVNIADLGLIYKCEVEPLEIGGYEVDIDMTLTAPGCGMGDVLAAEVQDKLLQLPQLKSANVNIVFDPPWDYHMIPDATKLTLGMM